jgi:hypothetical protein
MDSLTQFQCVDFYIVHVLCPCAGLTFQITFEFQHQTDPVNRSACWPCSSKTNEFVIHNRTLSNDAITYAATTPLFK